MLTRLFHRIKNFFGKTGARSRGGVLIGAVMTMVIMGFLGAGMVALLGSSTYHEVRAKNGEQAYYLAESGFRYAASYYGKNELDGLEEEFSLTDLEDDVMSGETVIDVPGGGSFTLQFKKHAGVTHNASSTVNVPDHGNIALDDSTDLVNRYGYFQHENSRYRYFSKVEEGGTHTITGITGDTIKRKIEAVVDADPNDSIIDSISLTSGTPIPLSDGSFRYGGSIYNYASYSGGALETITTVSGDLSTLVGLTEGTLSILPKFPIELTSGDPIEFAPMLEVFSTGTYGSAFFGVDRLVTYAWPVFGGAWGEDDVPIFDPGDELYGLDDPWDESDWMVGPGTSGEGDVLGEYMVVESVGDEGTPALFLAGMNPTEESMPSTMVMYAAQQITSSAYQVQIKIMLDEDLLAPNYYYVAGITFRKVTNNLTTGAANVKSYGISFVRGQHGLNAVPDALLPLPDNTPYLVLWRFEKNPTSGEKAATRLAYAPLTDNTVVTEDDSGTPDYDESGLLQPWSTVLVRVEQIGEDVDTAYNRIMVMYGDHVDKNVSKTGDTDPFDTNPYRKSSARDGISYPDDPEGYKRLPWPTNTLADWIADRDYFTVVEWSADVGGGATRVSETWNNTDKFVYIHTQQGENLFVEPDPDTTVSLEVGLHTWGENMEGKVYFDDFGILQATWGSEGTEYVTPIQY